MISIAIEVTDVKMKGKEHPALKCFKHLTLSLALI